MLSANAVKEPTPLPYRDIIILGCILSANNCAIWIIFTMIPFMVQHFFPELSVKELGYRAGMLGSAFSAGSLFGNFIWGIASDKIGRKPALILGLWGSVLSALMFGFTHSFWMVVFARFMWGLLNGNIGVSKTFMAEILDDSNNSRGMALYGSIGGVGRTIGPILGGYMLFPASSAPGLFAGTIFDTYPFALPVTLVSIACFVVSIVACYYLPETLEGSFLWVGPRESSTENCAVQMTPMLNGAQDSTPNTLLGRVTALTKNSSIIVSGSKSGPGYAQLGTNDMDEDSMHGGGMGNTPSPGARRVSLDAEENALEDVCIDDASPEGTPEAPSPRGSPDAMAAAAAAADNSSLMTPRRVGFASVVTVKTIGTGTMAYGPLKKIARSEKPVGRGDLSPAVPVGIPVDAVDPLEVEDARVVNTPLWGASLADKGAEQRSISNSSNGDDDDDEETANGGGVWRTTPVRSVERFSNGSEFYSESGDERDESQAKGLCGVLGYLLTRKQILLSTSLYGIAGFCSVLSVEIFPLWVVTSLKDGGFDYKAHDIGWAMTTSGPLAIVGQLFIYPRVAEKFGIIKTYAWACQLQAVTALLLPCVSLISDYTYISRVLLIVGLTLLCTTQLWIFISIFTFINNSCYSHQRATVNGIGQTFAAIGRLSAPYLGSTLFAWSENNDLPWPFNYALCWYLVCAVSLFAGSLAAYFPKSIQRRKREPKKKRYASPVRGGGYAVQTKTLQDDINNSED